MILLERPSEGAQALRKALAFDPTHSRAYAELVKALRAAQEYTQAENVLLHAKQHAAEPAILDALN